ncbi:hypothetical protein NQ038_04635 [Brevibacterium sp. 50QC2O2]|uniref:hypothetical protein n=1 Tax=unclassified Brevibacterium TaxID=2614124 RepID=UPI00211B90BB|nr:MULTISPECIES: hypothetical protein [unclassified Brevibacterium]MCQ9369319.1 hypothetical protein [Brevibacterium sp. 91QC2O2]MCQ9387932.1 hypothetical protein [Brevibacterium sp. 50QC2O2]
MSDTDQPRPTAPFMPSAPPPPVPPLPPQDPPTGAPGSVNTGGSRRSALRPALLGAGAGVLVLVLALGGFVLFRHLGAADFNRPPVASGRVDTTGLEDYALVPAPSGLVPPEKDSGYLFLAGEDSDAVAKLTPDSPSPDWIAPIPRKQGTKRSDCKLAEDHLDCGSVTIDLRTGDSTATGGDDTGSTGAGTEDITVDDTTITREGDTIVGRDPQGTEVWRVTVKDAKSFSVSGSKLYVKVADMMFVYDFAKRGGDTEQTVTDEQRTADRPQRLDKKAFAQGKLQIPSVCKEFVDYKEDLDPEQAARRAADQPFTEVTMSGGRFHPAGAPVDYQAAEVTKVVPMTVAGGPAAAVVFTCNPGGNYTYDSLAVYDAERKPLGSVEFAGADAPALLGWAPKLYLETVKATGDYLQLSVPVGVYGDGSCTGCEKSGTARYSYRLGADGLHMVDGVLGIKGKQVRKPAVQDVQRFLDAVRTGDDDYATKHATKEQMDTLSSVLGDGQEKGAPTVRSVQFGPGVKADSCEVVNPVDDSEYGTGTYYFANGKTLLGLGAQDIRPGDTVCGIVTDEIKTFTSDDSESCPIYLLLRGNAKGDVQAYYFGRQFS